MSRRPQEWPAVDPVDIAAELRRQLDDAAGKRAELERQVAARDARIAKLEAELEASRHKIDELTRADAAAEVDHG